MTTPQPQPRLSASEEARQYVCCGGKGSQQGEWVPKEGQPQVPGCAWCDLAGEHYWRNQT